MRVIKVVVLLAVVTLFWAGASVADAQSPIEILPPTPRPTDVFEIRVTYQTSCPFQRVERQVVGRTIAVTAVEGCACLPGLPGPRSESVFVGPLAPGPYTVRLFTLNAEQGEACGQPFLVATRGFEVEVGGDPGRLSLEPPHPTPDDPLRLTVRSPCPAQTSVEPPEISERVIRIVERVNNAILAPCFDRFVDVAKFELGVLEPGEYTIRLFTVETDPLGNGEVPDEPGLESAFTVAEVPRLVLADGRFTVEARWRTSQGTSGVGVPSRLTADTGTFWFFDPDNVEVVVKVLDACSFAGHFWVFAAGLTNVEVELRVVDTQAEVEELYVNPLGKPFEPIQDTGTFGMCE